MFGELEFHVAILALSLLLLPGLVNGLAGFGFALFGTAILATVLDPATAVVFLIIPLIAVNLSLATELTVSELRSCTDRFAPLIVAALGGTVVGMILLVGIPQDSMRIALGLLSLGFVASELDLAHDTVLERLWRRCLLTTTPAMVGVGAIGGILFGATNIGVQLVAYLRGLDLPHSRFVGMVALVFLGLNTVRIGAAWELDLYHEPWILWLSLLAVGPAVLGVAVGARLRPYLAVRTREWLVLGLLSVVGIRLILAGAGIA